MKTRRGSVIVLALVASAIASGCASTRAIRPDGTRLDRLSREQIMESQALNLFEAVQRLRPRWLDVRGGTRSFTMDTEIVVYQNDMLLGGVDNLRQMSPELAVEIRWVDGALAAATLPGLSSGRHISGAIVVRTRGR